MKDDPESSLRGQARCGALGERRRSDQHQDRPPSGHARRFLCLVWAAHHQGGPADPQRGAGVPDAAEHRCEAGRGAVGRHALSPAPAPRSAPTEPKGGREPPFFTLPACLQVISHVQSHFLRRHRIGHGCVVGFFSVRLSSFQRSSSMQSLDLQQTGLRALSGAAR